MSKDKEFIKDMRGGKKFTLPDEIGSEYERMRYLSHDVWARIKDRVHCYGKVTNKTQDCVSLLLERKQYRQFVTDAIDDLP